MLLEDGRRVVERGTFDVDHIGEAVCFLADDRSGWPGLERVGRLNEPRDGADGSRPHVRDDTHMCDGGREKGERIQQHCMARSDSGFERKASYVLSMHDIQESATVSDEEAHAVMLTPWHRTGGPLMVIEMVLASCRADMKQVQAHS